MSPERIKELTAFVPADDKDLYGQPDLPLGWRESWNMIVPQFGWLFCKSLVRAKLPLPECVNEPHLQTAYRHLNGSERSIDIEYATLLDFEYPAYTRLSMQAGLLDPAMPLDAVGDMAQLSAAFVELYHDLFFAVRERFEEKEFMAHVIALPYVQSLHLHGRRGELVRTPISQAQRRNRGLPDSITIVA